MSGSYDEAVFLWDVRSARLLRSLPAHQDPVSGVDFVWDGTLIASCGSGDGLIRIWDTQTGQCLKTMLHADNAAVTSVKFSPNGRYVLGWSLDSCVRLWDYREGGRCVKTYMGHRNEKWGLQGAFGIYGGDQDEEEEDGEDIRGGHRDQSRDAPPKAREKGSERAFVASGSEDGAIMFWDVVSKEVVQRIEDAHQGCVIAVDTHGGDNGDSGSDSEGEDRAISGKRQEQKKGKRKGTRMLVSGGLDGVIKVWEVKKEVKEIKDRPTDVEAEIVGAGVEAGVVDMENRLDVRYQQGVPQQPQQPQQLQEQEQEKEEGI